MTQRTYGSDEINSKTLNISNAEVSDDGFRVRLRVDGLRPIYVHELHATGVRNSNSQPLLHPHGYYTLNQIPAER